MARRQVRKLKDDDHDHAKGAGGGPRRNASCSKLTRNADDGCLYGRTCRDCLNVRLPGQSVCVLDTNGWCSDFDPTQDGPVSRGFLSNMTAYCAVSDPACGRCQRASVARNSVCRGSNGCVCLSACEQQSKSPMFMCPIAVDDQDTVRMNSIFLLPLIAVAFLLAFGAVRYYLHRRRRAFNQLRRNVRSNNQQTSNGTTVPSGTLTLEGWHSLREKLIAQEKKHGNTTPRDAAESDANACPGHPPSITQRLEPASVA